MMRQETMERALDKRVICIVRGLPADKMLALAEALYAGGIEMIEVTFNQANPASFSDTAASIRLITDHFQGKVLAGAGTVITPEQARIAADAGARYIISPNTDAAVIRATRELGLVSMPGALTPSEIIAAHNAGADIVKVFPAGVLGPAYIKAVRAPISHVRLMAVGGVSEKNAGDFIRAGAVGVGCGGNLVNKAWIDAGEFDRITALAREFAEAVRV